MSRAIGFVISFRQKCTGARAQRCVRKAAWHGYVFWSGRKAGSRVVNFFTPSPSRARRAGPVAPRKLPANEKLYIGVGGAGGKGSSDTDHCADENIVALCNVDTGALGSRKEKCPNARTHQNWREMLKQEKTPDPVIVATPDHMHAMVAATAIRMGKHVYSLLSEAAGANRLRSTIATQAGQGIWCRYANDQSRERGGRVADRSGGGAEGCGAIVPGSVRSMAHSVAPSTSRLPARTRAMADASIPTA